MRILVDQILLTTHKIYYIVQTNINQLQHGRYEHETLISLITFDDSKDGSVEWFDEASSPTLSIGTKGSKTVKTVLNKGSF